MHPQHRRTVGRHAAVAVALAMGFGGCGARSDLEGITGPAAAAPLDGSREGATDFDATLDAGALDGASAPCPGPVTTRPLRTVELSAASVGGSSAERFEWALLEHPPASGAAEPAPPDAASVRFEPDVAGRYVVRVRVFDADGRQQRQCDVTVIALAEEGLRIELFWNPPDTSCDRHPELECDNTDLDLHLLRPGDEPWFHPVGDCHFDNCIDTQPDWGPPGPPGNPRLALDAEAGFGPENINVDEPAAGTYRVGVDLWDPGVWGSASATVRIFCEPGAGEPTAVLGPVWLKPNERRTRDDNDFWRVADVTVDGDGACAVDALESEGAPSIISHESAHGRR